MARPQGTSPRAQRLIALLAVCAIAIATAFAFGRVFIGHGPTWELMAVALISALIASALERRNLLLATLVSAVGLAVVIGLFVFPGTTWHGLPTLETLRHALDASHLVGEQARIQVAPSPPLKPLMLASIVAMWAAIFSCHALAFRAGSPLLALLPPVVMVAFADTVLEEFIKPLYGVTFLAAALAIIFADALRRVQGWGPVWTGPGSRARLSATASRGARRVAVAAVGTAMIVPVPGSRLRIQSHLRHQRDERLRPGPDRPARLDQGQPGAEHPRRGLPGSVGRAGVLADAGAVVERRERELGHRTSPTSGRR